MHAPVAGGGRAPASLRVFFALWPDAASREVLAKLARDVAGKAGGRAPADGNLHLTLAFVGEVTPERVEALRAAGLAATAGVPAFDVSLDRVGSFRGAGVAWAGASRVPDELSRLAAELDAALAAQGVAVDPRPFHAHVTLARRCRRTVDMPLAPPIALPVARLVLNASDLGSGAARYREIAGWPLAAAQRSRSSSASTPG